MRKVSWWDRLLCFVLGHRLVPYDPNAGRQSFSYRMGVCLRCNEPTHPRGDRTWKDG